MNKLTAKQLLMMNQKLTAKEVVYSDALMKRLEEISILPYEQDERFFYRYRSTIEKASKLGCSIACIKPFLEKNTQTAILSLLTLLKSNKVQLSDFKSDLPTMEKLLESGDEEGTCAWIRDHMLQRIGID